MLKSIIKNLFRNLLREKIVQREFKHSQHKIEFRAQDHLSSFIQRELNYEFSNVIKEFVSPGDLIFDVGANIGMFSIQFSDWITEKGTVVAFEPDPEAARFLKKNIELNVLSNIKIEETALSESEGIKELYIDSITGGRRNSMDKDAVGNFVGKKIQIETTTLSNAIQKHGVPDLIKVDVEGSEIAVLLGISKLPRSTCYFLEMRNNSQKEILEMFLGEGFQFFVVKENNLMALDNKELNSIPLIDAVFIHPEHINSLREEAQSLLLLASSKKA